jgi:hypothetical protein
MEVVCVGGQAGRYLVEKIGGERGPAAAGGHREDKGGSFPLLFFFDATSLDCLIYPGGLSCWFYQIKVLICFEFASEIPERLDVETDCTVTFSRPLSYLL